MTKQLRYVILGLVCNAGWLGSVHAAGVNDCKAWIDCATPLKLAQYQAPSRSVQGTQNTQNTQSTQGTQGTRARTSVPAPSITTPAPAAEPSRRFNDEPPKDRVLYLGFELGMAPVEDLADDSADDVADDFKKIFQLTKVDAKVTQDLWATGGRFFLGVEVTENLAVEFGYSRLYAKMKVKVRGENRNGYGTFNESDDISWSTADLSVLLRPDVSSGIHGLFGRIGLHSTENQIKYKQSLAIPSLQYNYSNSGRMVKTKTGLVLGLGYDWFFGEKASHVLRASYTYYGNVPDVSDDWEIKDGFLKNNALNVFRFGYHYRF